MGVGARLGCRPPSMCQYASPLKELGTYWPSCMTVTWVSGLGEGEGAMVGERERERERKRVSTGTGHISMV